MDSSVDELFELQLVVKANWYIYQQQLSAREEVHAQLVLLDSEDELPAVDANIQTWLRLHEVEDQGVQHIPQR